MSLLISRCAVFAKKFKEEDVLYIYADESGDPGLNKEQPFLEN